MAVGVSSDNTREWKSAFDRALGRALEKCGLAAEGYAKRLCPVKTGRLRNSITHTTMDEDGKAFAVIGTNVEYAAYVELGTSRTGKKPYLVPAATDNKTVYEAILRAELDGR